MGLPLILASASPRRRELLQQMGLSFGVVPSDVQEEMSPGLSPTEAAREVAVRKCTEVSTRHRDAIVIAADTVVVLGSRMLGKPGSNHEAAEMLRALSGRAHQVVTGLAVFSEAMDRRTSCSVVTEVCFRDISDFEIDLYVSTGECTDKAGAYAIQGRGAVFVDSISGCYPNVVGLPIAQLATILPDFGVSVPLLWRHS